jgi:hypothetical protein
MSFKVKTGLLYSDPSFLSGLSRTLDLYGMYDDYNMAESPAEADACAIAADWIVIGQDIQDAIQCFEQEDAA